MSKKKKQKKKKKKKQQGNPTIEVVVSRPLTWGPLLVSLDTGNMTPNAPLSQTHKMQRCMTCNNKRTCLARTAASHFEELEDNLINVDGRHFFFFSCW